VRLRAERLGIAATPGLWLVAETELSRVAARVAEVDPTHLVPDSIQTVFDAALEAAPGSVAQVRHSTSRLVRMAKQRAMAAVLCVGGSKYAARTRSTDLRRSLEFAPHALARRSKEYHGIFVRPRALHFHTGRSNWHSRNG